MNTHDYQESFSFSQFTLWFTLVLSGSALIASDELMAKEKAEPSDWVLGSRHLPLPAAASDELQQSIAVVGQPNKNDPRRKAPNSIKAWRQEVAQHQKTRLQRVNVKQLEQNYSVSIGKESMAGVTVFRIMPEQVDPETENHVMMYLHGGAYVFSAGEAGLYEAAVIANSASIPVISVDYRMPPDYPFPAAVKDAVAVYKAILESYPANHIAIGGTSAGGGLSLATVQQLVRGGLPTPAAVYAGTPWADLSNTSDTLHTNEGIDRILVSYDGILSAAAILYTGEHDLKHPGISPLYGDFSQFPPTYLVSGTRDLLLSDTARVHRKLREAKVSAELNVYEGMSHADYSFVAESPESRQVYLELADFLGQNLKGHQDHIAASNKRIATAAASAPHTPQKPTQVYWGDTHLHSNLSVDANGMGNKLLSPSEAYRFSRGEAVVAHNGQMAQLARPLDFVVMADHAVNMGVLPAARKKQPLIMRTTIGKSWAEKIEKYGVDAQALLRTTNYREYKDGLSSLPLGSGPSSFFWYAWSRDYVADEPFRRSVWDDVCAQADSFNTPGEFTAFIGYEWTPSALSKRSPNFHRNVIFKGATDKACQVLPFTMQDSENVEELWAYLDRYEKKTGDRVLAIPHNGNLSSGMMFKLEDYAGKEADEAYSTARARWEPLYEVTQYKGDAEAHPALSPNDEFADFETWHQHGFFGDLPENFVEEKRYEYARPALKLGLGAEQAIGVNPFKFGMIGATDSHTSLSAADEDNFWGKITMHEPSPHRLYDAWQYSAAGHAAVWASDNTRESLFAAMQRKEVYATTGPRMVVRFFAGWDFEASDAQQAGIAEIGYQGGVPMGGDLPPQAGNRAPRFLVSAAKDPIGANLDRIQIIKGWVTAEGKEHEKVYDVALSDGRKPSNKGGKAEAVGNTVDLKQPSYSNTIGAPQLAVVWEDPEFNAQERAFYYARIIEIPTPRWTAYDVTRFDLQAQLEQANADVSPFGPEGTDQEIPMITQDRAYTSPIWYTPKSAGK